MASNPDEDPAVADLKRQADETTNESLEAYVFCNVFLCVLLLLCGGCGGDGVTE